MMIQSRADSEKIVNNKSETNVLCRSNYRKAAERYILIGTSVHKVPDTDNMQ